jgi:imidazolonepropionase-like amidohydrolase
MRIESKLLLASIIGAATLCAETKVLEGFTLIDGTGKAAQADSAMVITDGRIQWIGAKAQLKAPAGAERINLAGKFVMPGIINLHGHLGNTIDLVQDPKNFTRENMTRNLKTYASYGVTTVMSMGSDQDLVYAMRAEQRAGRPKMTRIFTAGRGFTGKAGYPTTAPGMKGVPYEVETTAQVEKDVAELAAKKVDLVKIWVDDHLGRETKIPLNLSAAIIQQAHKHGLKVAAHIFYLQDAKDLVAAGLDGLAHSVRDKPVDQALIDLMKKKGAWQAAATLTREASVFAFVKTPPFINDPFFTRGVSPAVVAALKSDELHKKMAAYPGWEKFPGFLETAKKNLKKLVDSGVNYGFGTDTGPPARFPGYYEHWEMELTVEAGLTPMQIITAFSKRNAEFLGVSKTLGTLEAGKWADLVVLEKNPLTDIKNTRTIQKVFIAGNVVN